MAKTVKSVMKNVETNADLLSYIINVTPELRNEIDLPTQGQDLRPIGQLIVSNQRYKNAFLNTINVIGLTVIDRNYWENPWDYFTLRGNLNFGQTVREMICDIADVFQYNEYENNPTHFLENVVPNVFQYLHELNFQDFYKTTTSDEQIAMAFYDSDGLFDLIGKIVESLYTAYQYDRYLIDKYQLCRRILDGTITSIEIPDYETLDKRDRVEFLKDYSNKLTFMTPKYNPAGIRVATPFNKQIAIINTGMEAAISTNVLATSFFKDEAEMRTRSAMIDDFAETDEERLQQCLKNSYIPFTEEEKEQLKNVIATIIDEEWFQDYIYSLDNQSEPNGSFGINGTRASTFYNPETLKNNHWLHVWMVYSTSPFKNAIVFTKSKPSVTSVSVSPAESTVSAGLSAQLTTNVVTQGFANKAVIYEVEEAPGQQEGSPVTVDSNGLVKIPRNYTSTNTDNPNPIVIKVTSVFDKTKSNTATITVL